MNALMTHIVAGYPNLEVSEEVALKMIEAGVSYLEIQIPFSDPVADGPTIMKASQVALDSGTTPEDCFELMKRLREKTDIPLLFMSYFNIAFRYGLEKFCQRAQEVGCYGLIIPDIPYDEESSEHYLELCKKYNLHSIQVISPLTPESRLRKISEIASGFVYCVSQTGTTGTRSEMNQELSIYIERVKQHIDLPLAVGFGISSREHVEEVLNSGDIAVIGSKVIRILEEGSSPEKVKEWIESVL